jgi:hypothetical protein
MRGRLGKNRMMAAARGWSRRAAPWLAAATALTACGSGTPVKRGFDSREVLQIRDPTFDFNGGFDATSIGYSTSADGGFSFFYVNLMTDQVQTGLPDAGTGATGVGYYCQLPTDPTTNLGTVVVIDSATGQQMPVLDGVANLIDCPHGTSTTLTVLKPDPTGALTLWTGPFDSVVEVPLSINIERYVFGIGLVVLAAYPAQPNQLGLFSIDLTSFAVTELIPPTLGTAAWANGAAGTGSLASSSLVAGSKSFPGVMTVYGGGYVYERAMDDGSTILFAGPFSSGPASELALFEPASSMTLSLLSAVAPPKGYFDMPIWLDEDGAGQTKSILVWNAGLQGFANCPLASSIAPLGVASSDGNEILFGASISYEQSDPGGTSSPLLLVSFAPRQAGTCTMLASAKAEYADFSSDGSSVFWVVQPATGDATLWTAAGDGSGARMIGSGAISQPRFATGTELEFEIGGDLVWVDTTDASNSLHYVAEQVFGTAIDVEGPWVVTGYDYSTTDGTGLLGLVNRENGNKRLISPEVYTYESQYRGGTNGGGSLSAGPADAGTPATQIAYLVRGRNPSTQDGIWVATIAESDLE